MSKDTASASKGEEAVDDIKVVYKFRDKNSSIVAGWNAIFGTEPYFNETIEVSHGDIFKGAPSADAIVSPANSFGFMDGGIDMALSRYFGWGMSSRLRDVIVKEYDGELLVGQAAIILTNVQGEDPPPPVGGKHIKWLISAPTMRVPMDVSHTANAYLAFRAIILAVQRHNRDPSKTPIRSVLCPGLGSMVGKMPGDRCAYQMRQAYEINELGLHKEYMSPESLPNIWAHHSDMAKYKQ